MVETPESLTEALLKIGLTPDTPGAEYEKMKKFIQPENSTFSAENEWYVLKTLEAFQAIFPLLQARHWKALGSVKGCFIGSDNPVVLVGPEGSRVGFQNAEVVVYPASRYVSLYSTKRSGRLKPLTQMGIAAQNTGIMLAAAGKSTLPHRTFAGSTKTINIKRTGAYFQRKSYC